MGKRWIERFTVLGFALLTLLIAYSKTWAQDYRAQINHRQTSNLTLEGPAIHILVVGRLPRGDFRKLVTSSHTARDHPDLAAYYRGKAQRLKAEAEKYEQFARSFGDRVSLNGDSHFSGSRNAFYYHVIAGECLRQARDAELLADLNAQAAEREGCFACHSFHGRGGKIAPDLAIEGIRGRTIGWLIGHFKDPRTYSSKSLMPALDGLTNRQLEALATFLEYQGEK